MSDIIQVMTTTETRADAQVIARALVQGRLAACVQIIGPISSVYWWEDAITEAEEYLCLAKTHADRFAAVEAAISEVHPYDVPEVLAVPVSAASSDYLAWLAGEIRAR